MAATIRSTMFLALTAAMVLLGSTQARRRTRPDSSHPSEVEKQFPVSDSTVTSTAAVNVSRRSITAAPRGNWGSSRVTRSLPSTVFDSATTDTGMS